VDQEEHAEAMSTEHKRTGKIYRHHITETLPRVRLGIVIDKSLELRRSRQYYSNGTIIVALRCDIAYITYRQ
jgi:hypothetical protein